MQCERSHEHVSRLLACWSAASAWMFPWEKRQMEGGSGPLRTWERVYWGVFVTGLSFFLLSRLHGKSAASTEDPEAGHSACAVLLQIASR